MKSFLAVLFICLGVALAVPAHSQASTKISDTQNYSQTSSVGSQAQADETEKLANYSIDSEKDEGDHGAVVHFGLVFAMFALVLMAGKLGSKVEKWGQPAVIGKLLAGVGLAIAGYFGWGFIDEIRSSEAIAFVAGFGALLLLFSIGLESNLKEMKKVGASSVRVAFIGVILPFLAGVFIAGPFFYGDEPLNARLFLGAALVATSVGIPSSVLRGLKLTKTKASQTFLGATVIDDVLGLMILAIVSALATGSEASAGMVALFAFKAFGFLAGAVILGSLLTNSISKLFKAIHPGIAMKLALAIVFMLVLSYLAELFGLEPIIGAFAAGLLLDSVHFDHFEDPDVVNDLRALEFKAKKDREAVLRVINKHKDSHIEDLINNISLVFVPVFFVSIGLQVNFEALLQPSLYITALVIAVIAFLSKFVAGLGMSGSLKHKMFVGACMVPRGEVGLIFAATGKALGVLSDEMFSVIVLVVIITTFVAPPLIKKIGYSLYPQKA